MHDPRRLVRTRPTGNGRARGLLSSRTSGRRIDAWTYAPPEDLADVVAAFWVGVWDLRGQSPHVTELLGDPCIHFVFETGDRRERDVVGVWTRTWKRTLSGKGRVCGVKLRPGATRAWLPEPAYTYTNRISSLDGVLAGEVKELHASMSTAEDDSLVFEALGAWLRLNRQNKLHVQTRQAVDLYARISGDPALTTVEQLADCSGLSVRGVQRLFRAHVGASPKWAIRRNRLQELALRLEKGESVGLAQLALELGYTDQAHLSRDFKLVVGKSPLAFAASHRSHQA